MTERQAVMFNPFTGQPRDPRDIASDPYGQLIWDGETPLQAARTLDDFDKWADDWGAMSEQHRYVAREAWQAARASSEAKAAPAQPTGKTLPAMPDPPESWIDDDDGIPTFALPQMHTYARAYALAAVEAYKADLEARAAPAQPAGYVRSADGVLREGDHEGVRPGGKVWQPAGERVLLVRYVDKLGGWRQSAVDDPDLASKAVEYAWATIERIAP